MKKISVVVVISLLFCMTSFADQVVVSKKVDHAPVIDGMGTDNVWASAPEYVTRDKVANADITMKTAHTDTEIFFLVSYPDREASITHKTWIWDKDKEMYDSGADREDILNIEWNMNPSPVDFSLTSDEEYKTDIWFWKADRTDPVGYADDKYHIYSAVDMPKSEVLTTKTGKTMHLMREGDEGVSAYENTFYTEYQGDIMPHFSHQIPTGSRADIKAKGAWANGRWTIEFARALKTGHGDDIQFDTAKEYLFGISRYEISGRDPDPSAEQPLYGSGDISEVLTLKFE